MSNPWARWLALHDTALFQMSRKAGWDAFVNAAPRPDFPTLTVAEMADLSPEEAEDYGEARIVWNANPPTVRTQQLASAYQVIDEVMASNRRDADKLRGSVVIDAEPYLGKTTIATRYARVVPDDEHDTMIDAAYHAKYGSGSAVRSITSP